MPFSNLAGVEIVERDKAPVIGKLLALVTQTRMTIAD